MAASPETGFLVLADLTGYTAYLSGSEAALSESRPQANPPRPAVRTSSDLAEPPEQQTPGIRRRQAFAGDNRRVGHVETQPGEWSGWHHHGETDTYLYVLAGGLESRSALPASASTSAPGTSRTCRPASSTGSAPHPASPVRSSWSGSAAVQRWSTSTSRPGGG